MRHLVIGLIVTAFVLSPYRICAEEHYPADNSGTNARDRNGAHVTAGDQGNDKSDIKITQEIRQAVEADKSLSVNAHNVKIITTNGHVTLRGPVNSAQEKAVVEAKAKSVVGPQHVESELKIAAQ